MSTGGSSRPPWYRIPVLWVAGLALLASLIGCFINIGVALRYADTSLTEVAPGSRFALPARGNRDPEPGHDGQ